VAHVLAFPESPIVVASAEKFRRDRRRCVRDGRVAVMKCRWSVATVIAASTFVVSCERRAPPPSRAPAAAATDAKPAPEPRTLLSLPTTSAYHATIAAADDDTAYLLTAAAAYRLAPGRAPERMPLDLGAGATTTRSSFVHWSRGAIVESPKAGGAARRLVALASPPQAIVVAGDRIAWVQRSGDGRFSVQALFGKSPRTAYASAGSIDAIAAIDDGIFFVERTAATATSGWRIGRVPAAGGAPTFTSLRAGRAPAMLVGQGDLFYYQGDGYEVRRLSPDLQRERSLASGFVCSPIAVSAYVYCAQVEGIFELRPDERPRRLVPGGAGRMVTDLAATPRRLLWIVDAGPDRLEVRELALAR
jgi:hypothetical protein